MKLLIKDVSSLLMITEKEINHMIRKNEIPFQILQDKVWFNKQQIIEWALTRNRPINLSGSTRFEEFQIKTIVPLLGEKSFFYQCVFTESGYIDQMVAMVQFDASVDRDVVGQLLKSREQLMSTAIGNGIALPHPRIPLIVGRDKPLINFFFPQTPLNLNSIDGKPVHSIILIISQTIKQHLSLLAHLSFLLSQGEFHDALSQRKPFQELIGIIEKLESSRR